MERIRIPRSEYPRLTSPFVSSLFRLVLKRQESAGSNKVPMVKLVFSKIKYRTTHISLLKVGLALQYGVFAPSLMTSLTSKLDEWQVPSVWLNDSQTPIDTLDVCGMVLGATKKVKVGTGVLRIHEYNLPQLAARAYTLNEVSRGRFILGVGTERGSGRQVIAN